MRPTPRRTLLCATLALIAAGWAAPGGAQQKVHRIGFLAPQARPTSSSPNASHAVFVKQLRELGYIEGANLVIEWRFAEGIAERLPGLAAELVKAKVDVIVTQATPATFSAKQAAAGSIPIVFIGVTDPVGRGLVADLSRPGGNVTGGANFAGGPLIFKQVELLREIIPKLSRLGILSPKLGLGILPSSNIWDKVAESGIKVTRVRVGKPSEFAGAFAEMVEARVQAVILTPDALYSTYKQQVLDLAMKHRLPIGCGSAALVEAGALLSYSEEGSDLATNAAIYVDKILKGVPPGDLPIVQSTKMALSLNARTAKAFGLTIPHSLLVRADRVIE